MIDRNDKLYERCTRWQDDRIRTFCSKAWISLRKALPSCPVITPGPGGDEKPHLGPREASHAHVSSRIHPFVDYSVNLCLYRLFYVRNHFKFEWVSNFPGLRTTNFRGLKGGLPLRMDNEMKDPQRETEPSWVNLISLIAFEWYSFRNIMEVPNLDLCRGLALSLWYNWKCPKVGYFYVENSQLTQMWSPIPLYLKISYTSSIFTPGIWKSQI